MNKLNFLQKLSPVGATLGLIVVSASMLPASSVSAANFPDQICGTFSPFDAQDVICEDKLFSNFQFNASVPVPPESVYTVSIAENIFFVDFDTRPGGGIGGPFTAQVSYMVEIVDIPETPKNEVEWYSFSAVDLDSEVGGTPPNTLVTKDIFDEFGNLLLALDSPNGNSDFGFLPTMPKKILVEDTVTVADGSVFFSFENSFIQKKAPEPGTILGLLAISGLGLGLKKKKQS